MKTKAWARSLAVKVRQPDPRHPADLIHEALAKIFVMATASTAENERDFAHHAKHFVRTDRGLAHDDWRMMERQISEACSHKAESFLRKLSIQAQLIWLEGYGRPRASGKKKRMNFSSGKKRDPRSLESFVRSRRSSVQKALKGAKFKGASSSDELKLNLSYCTTFKLYLVEVYFNLISIALYFKLAF